MGKNSALYVTASTGRQVPVGGPAANRSPRTEDHASFRHLAKTPLLSFLVHVGLRARFGDRGSFHINFTHPSFTSCNREERNTPTQSLKTSVHTHRHHSITIAAEVYRYSTCTVHRVVCSSISASESRKFFSRIPNNT